MTAALASLIAVLVFWHGKVMPWKMGRSATSILFPNPNRLPDRLWGPEAHGRNSHRYYEVRLSSHMKKVFPSAVALAMLLSNSTPILAHHGTGTEYDAEHPVTLKGTVTEFVWANPHVQVYFDVTDAKGNVVHWSSETLSPGKLARGGWTRDAIKAGDVITVSLDPSKKGTPVGFLRNIVLPDGKILKANPLGPPPP